MTKKYFIWKDPACGGKNIEWLEVSGREFYQMLQDVRNASRCFVRLGNDACPEADILIVEATKKQYALWKREQNAHAYLAKYESMVQIESLDDTSGGEGELPLHERLADHEIDVERAALAAVLSEQLARGLQNLPPEEAALLCSYYVHRKTAREIADKLGISQQAVWKRLQRGLGKLKKYFE